MRYMRFETLEKTVERLEQVLAVAQPECDLSQWLDLKWAAQKFLEHFKRNEYKPQEYIVVNDKHKYMRHSTFNAAFREANRLSLKHGGEFTISKVKATVQQEIENA